MRRDRDEGNGRQDATRAPAIKRAKRSLGVSPEEARRLAAKDTAGNVPGEQARAPSGAGLACAADVALSAAYWAVLLAAMRGRIGAPYGAYALFESLSVLRALAVPLLVTVTGAVFFFGGRLGPWQYLAASAGAAVLVEVCGNALAMGLYGQPYREVAGMLGTPAVLIVYVGLIFALWAVLCLMRAAGFAIKRIREASAIPDMQSEYERERREMNAVRAASMAGPYHTYASGGLHGAGYWLKCLALCEGGAFLASGAVLIFMEHWGLPMPPVRPVLFVMMGLGAALSAAIAWAYGRMRVEVGRDAVVIKQWNRAARAYAFQDFQITAATTKHLAAGRIPLGAARYLVLQGRVGRRARVRCRNFSQKTFGKMTDEIRLLQRAAPRRAGEKENAALAAERRKNLAGAVGIGLPMPGEDGFVSFEFTINKRQMVSVEQARYGKIALGLLVSCALLYAAWYWFVYPLPPGPTWVPIPGLVYLVAGMIATVHFIVPVAVMNIRFAQEKRRTPTALTVERTRFSVDGRPFEFEEVQHLWMTHPQAAIEAGATSHRRHLVFFHGSRRHVYTIGSGTVPGAGFPDYPLLYAAFAAQHACMENPAPAKAAQYMRQATVKLTPFTAVTIQAQRISDLATWAKIRGVIAPDIR